MRRALFLALAVASSLAAAPASAAEESARAEARAVGEQGDVQFYAGRCDKAVPLWRRADALYHAPTLVLRIARCQAMLGQVVAASSSLQAIVDEPSDRDTPTFAAARDDARRELPRVRARIASLRVVVRPVSTMGLRPAKPGSAPNPEGPVRPPGVPIVVEIDGVPAPAATEALPMDPGLHQVRVRADRVAWSREVRLDDGEARTLDVPLRVEPLPSVPLRQRNAGFVTLGVSVAALAAGVGLSVSALSTSRALGAVCGPSRTACPPSAQPSIDRARAYSIAADGTLGGGALLAVAGAVLLTADFRVGHASRVRLGASPLSLVITGEL